VVLILENSVVFIIDKTNFINIGVVFKFEA